MELAQHILERAVHASVERVHLLTLAVDRNDRDAVVSDLSDAHIRRGLGTHEAGGCVGKERGTIPG